MKGDERGKPVTEGMEGIRNAYTLLVWKTDG
jgi:hypothetical protein